MQSVKRLEIIASSRELPKLIHALDVAGVSGYAVIRDVVGKSDGSNVSDDFDLAATTLSNVYILAFCPETQLVPVVEQLKPVLNKLGGACYISEAREVRSFHCIA